jgi:hypothetical protein
MSLRIRRNIIGNTPYLYDTLVQVLRQHRNWLDLRHLQTLAWRWGEPFWLDNDKMAFHALYNRPMQQALVGWVDMTLKEQRT